MGILGITPLMAKGKNDGKKILWENVNFSRHFYRGISTQWREPIFPVIFTGGIFSMGISLSRHFCTGNFFNKSPEG